VSADFDSMLAKLIAHGATRDLAIARLRQALQDTLMLGVTLNTDFLNRVLAHPTFQAGATDTGFLERYKAELRPREWTDAERQALVAVAAASSKAAHRTELPPVFAAMGAWRN
jgi:acetyl/propionyl-CoA carboxylase alpha subunit